MTEKIDYPQLTEYKGHPVITLPTASYNGFSFGIAKAEAILEWIDEITAFVNSEGRTIDPEDTI